MKSVAIVDLGSARWSRAALKSRMPFFHGAVVARAVGRIVQGQHAEAGEDRVRGVMIEGRTVVAFEEQGRPVLLEEALEMGGDRWLHRWQWRDDRRNGGAGWKHARSQRNRQNLRSRIPNAPQALRSGPSLPVTPFLATLALTTSRPANARSQFHFEAA
jgi:hypothetical protein